MKRFRNFSLGLATFFIVYFIFMIMNELVAQLIFYFGLTIIGLYIFRGLNILFQKLYNKTKDIRLVDCGFWQESGKYKANYQLVNFLKERETE